MCISIMDLSTIVGRNKTSCSTLTYCFLPCRSTLATFIWLHIEPPRPTEGLAVLSGNPTPGDELGVSGGWGRQYFPSSIQTTCISYHLHSILLSISQHLTANLPPYINWSEANPSQLKSPHNTPSKNHCQLFSGPQGPCLLWSDWQRRSSIE